DEEGRLNTLKMETVPCRKLMTRCPIAGRMTISWESPLSTCSSGSFSDYPHKHLQLSSRPAAAKPHRYETPSVELIAGASARSSSQPFFLSPASSRARTP